MTFLKRLLQRVKNYALLMRLHRPIGIFLLLWPTLIALWFANQGTPTFKLIAIFVLGVLIMRSAGCVINDIADIRFDGLVARTKERPLITGKITAKEALVLFVGLLFIGFLLILVTNPLTIAFSLVAAALAAFYPFTKRYIDLPQVILGVAFGWAIPMAYSASNVDLSLECWLLYLATLLWAVAYDTQYAMVDKKDDMKIGVKSSAILFGKWDKFWIGFCHCCTLCLLWWIGIRLQLGKLYFTGIIIGAILAIYQQWLIRNRDPKNCFAAFLNNQWIGAVLFLGTCF